MTQATSTVSPQETKQNVSKPGYSSVPVDNDEFENGYRDGHTTHPKDIQPLTVDAIRKLLIETLGGITARADWDTGHIAEVAKSIYKGQSFLWNTEPKTSSVQLGSVTLHLNHWSFHEGYYTGQRVYKANQAKRPPTHTVTAMELLYCMAHYDAETGRYSLTENELTCLENHLGQCVGYLCAALFPEPIQEHDTKRGNKPHPNELKTVAKEAGLTIRELSEETNIPLPTLYYWSAGKGIIPRWACLKIAQVIGCELQDLAPQEHNTKRLPVTVWEA